MEHVKPQFDEVLKDAVAVLKATVGSDDESARGVEDYFLSQGKMLHEDSMNAFKEALDKNNVGKKVFANEDCSNVNESPDQPSDSSTATEPASTPTPLGPSQGTCDVSYKFLYDAFQIRGKDWDASKFGDNGAGLKKQLTGCGDLTNWHFELTPNDPNGYQWFASGRLPVFTNKCIGRAIISAGGSGKDPNGKNGNDSC